MAASKKDNVNAGRMLGEYARKLIDKDSKIAIVSHVKGVSTAVEREQGFREGLVKGQRKKSCLRSSLRLRNKRSLKYITKQ